ncbi:MAG: hypothetical protein Q9M50_08380 [Methylococcales bacterium]|nr:hypothetical protein [Methylococcales bacterium]
MYCMSWWIDKLGMTLSGRDFCLDSIIAQKFENWSNKTSSEHWNDRLKNNIIKLAFFYASLNSDSDYASLNELFLQHAQKQFSKSKTFVTFGHSHSHSHSHKIEYFSNDNIYVNTGSFCAQNQYSFRIFSTDRAKVEVLSSDI